MLIYNLKISCRVLLQNKILSAINLAGLSLGIAGVLLIGKSGRFIKKRIVIDHD